MNAHNEHVIDDIINQRSNFLPYETRKIIILRCVSCHDSERLCTAREK